MGVQEPSDEIVGKVLDGRFEVKSVLGEGGLGFVYLARDRELGRDVALKILVPRYRGRPERESRLLAEAVKAKAVEHPRVVTSLGSGRLRDLGGCPFALFELVSGSSLNVRLAYDGAFEPLRAAKMLRELAGLVHACHAVRIVHRDVSVQNIFLEDDGALTLIDFSHAARLDETKSRATLHGEIPGAPWYMSPEQARGEQAAASMDVFALGVVGFELLIGRNPYRSVQMDIFAELQGREELRQPKIDCRIFPDVPEPLAKVINGALTLRASDRSTLPSFIAKLDEALVEMRAMMGGGSLEEPADNVSSLSGHTMPMRRPAVIAEGARPAGDETLVQLVRGGAQMPSAKLAHAGLEKVGRDEALVSHPGQLDVSVGFEPGATTARESPSVRSVDPAPPERGTIRGRLVLSAAVLLAVFVAVAVAVKPSPRVLVAGLWARIGDVVKLEASAPGHEGAASDAVQGTAGPAKIDVGSVAEDHEEESVALPDLGAKGAEVQGPKPRDPKPRSPRPRNPKSHDSEPKVDESEPALSCAEQRSGAKAAAGSEKWKAALAFTKEASCWSAKNDRAQIRAEAFFHQKRYAQCVRAAAGATSTALKKLRGRCYLAMENPE
ncbi:MAG: serine/threonine protein kinase [Nannocystales bacterium]